MRSLKRIALGGVLSAALLVAPATAALADVGADDTANVSASVSDNATGTAYKVIEVNWDAANQQPVEPQYTWAEPIQAWVTANYPDYINDDGSVSKNFEESLGDMGGLDANRRPIDNGAATFYDQLSAAINSGAVSGLATESSTMVDDNANFTLGMGGYLVLFKGGDQVYRPSAVIVKPVWDEANQTWNLEDQDLTVKASEPNITKEVNDPQYMGDDQVQFTLRADVPVYPDDAIATTYKIGDVLPGGMTLVDGSIEVFGVSGGNESALVVDDAYELTTPEGKTFELIFNYKAIQSFEQIKVVYNTTVDVTQLDLVNGNGLTNNANLTYTNDPYVETDKDKTDEQTVYTYGVEVLKVDNEGNALAGAEFSLAMKDSDRELYFKSTGEGMYAVVPAGTEGATQVLKTDAGGKLYVDGLDVGAHELQETKAPNSYVKLDKPIEFSIIDEGVDGTVDQDASATSGAYVSATVKNSKGFDLPVTGAGGVAMLVGIAAVLGVGGATILATTRRKQQK